MQSVDEIDEEDKSVLRYVSGAAIHNASKKLRNHVSVHLFGSYEGI